MMDTSLKKRKEKKTNPYVNNVLLIPHPTDPSDMHHVNVFNVHYKLMKPQPLEKKMFVTLPNLSR